MTRYYFHIRDGHTSLDNEGLQLADIDAVRGEAVRISADVLRDGANGALWAGQPWALWVTDEASGAGDDAVHAPLRRIAALSLLGMSELRDDEQSCRYCPGKMRLRGSVPRLGREPGYRYFFCEQCGRMRAVPIPSEPRRQA